MRNKLKKIDEFALQKVKRSHLPGLSLAVIDDGEITHTRGIGHSNLEAGLPATAETLYGIGSITKSFTCLAIMQLAEEGRLNIQDEVADYLDFDIRPGGKPVRIEHLMSHTSGIPALAYAEAVIRKGIGDVPEGVPIGDVQDMLTFMAEAGDWAHAEPGERWFYLNEGYVLLGGIIECVSGRPYAEYVTENILKPLGMHRSFFSREEVEADRDAAQPYVVDGEGGRHPKSYMYGSITADGGLISNVEDMARYIQMYLGGGRLNGERILSEESVREMMKPRIGTPAADFFRRSRDGRTLTADFSASDGPRKYGYGLGMTRDFFRRRMVEHGGSVLVSTGQMSFMPDEGLGVMLLANGSGYPLGNLAHYALAVLLDEDPNELRFRAAEVFYEGLPGVYESYMGNHRGTVRRSGDFLQFETAGEHLSQTVPLIPERVSRDGALFFTLQGGSKMPVEFVRHEEAPTELIFERHKMRRVSDVTE